MRERARAPARLLDAASALLFSRRPGDRVTRASARTASSVTPNTRFYYDLPVFTMILLLVHPPLPYQLLCIFLSASQIRGLLGSVDPNDRAPLVTF